MVQGPEFRSPGSRPKYVCSPHAHFFTIFAVPRGGVRNSQPSLGEPSLPWEPSPAEVQRAQAVSVRNSGEGFFGRKAKGRLEIPGFALLLTARCLVLARLQPGGGSSSAVRPTQRVRAWPPCFQEIPGPPLRPVLLTGAWVPAKRGSPSTSSGIGLRRQTGGP